MLYIILTFISLGVFANEAGTHPQQTSELKQASEMLNFAKNSLIKNTELAKNEFGIKDEPKPEQEPINFDKKYNTTEYRDIFYNAEDSALVNQAVDYFLQGKLMNVKPRKFIIKKVQNIKKPFLQLSSILYNSELFWTIFTNIGKFTYTQPFVKEIRITGISRDEVEFTIPIAGEMRNTIKEKYREIENMERVSLQNRNVIITLRTGECVFEDSLTITKSCAPIIEEIEKQVEI